MLNPERSPDVLRVHERLTEPTVDRSWWMAVGTFDRAKPCEGLRRPTIALCSDVLRDQRLKPETGPREASHPFPRFRGCRRGHVTDHLLDGPLAAQGSRLPLCIVQFTKIARERCALTMDRVPRVHVCHAVNLLPLRVDPTVGSH